MSTIDEKIARSRVLVIGVGGLGAPAATALAAAGVGTVGLIDPDMVELSNLHRQPLYASADVGRAKVEVAAERLGALAPALRLETWHARFGPPDAHLLRRFDLVLDGTDTIAAKFVVNDAAILAGVRLVHAGVLGFRAQLLTVLPGRSACYRCIFEEAPPPGDVPSCQEAGVLGPVAALAGALQAAEAIRLLAGDPAAYANALFAIDTQAGSWRTVPLAPARAAPCAPPAPSKGVTPHELREGSPLSRVRRRDAGRPAARVRDVLRPVRGPVRLPGHPPRADAREDRRAAAQSLALPRAPADRGRAARRAPLGHDAARARRSARRRARREGALGEGRLGEPPDLLLQGPGRLGRDVEGDRVRLRHRVVRLDRQPRQLGLGARRARRPRLLHLHPRRPGAGQGHRLRHLRPAHHRRARQLR